MADFRDIMMVICVLAVFSWLGNCLLAWLDKPHFVMHMAISDPKEFQKSHSGNVRYGWYHDVRDTHVNRAQVASSTHGGIVGTRLDAGNCRSSHGRSGNSSHRTPFEHARDVAARKLAGVKALRRFCKTQRQRRALE